MTKNTRQEGQSAQAQNQAAESQDAPQDTSLLQRVLQQADAVASSAATNVPQELDSTPLPPVDDVPPPPYSAGQYGEVDIREHGFDTGARVASDGRVDIKIEQVNRRLTHMLTRQLTHQGEPEPYIPEGLGEVGGLPCPPLNIVIQVVGSRGDVQPFIALGQVLKNKFNHRVRLATHPVFRDFVIENGLEFFSIGGDPADLMAFMVKNPGLLPGMEALKSGAIGKKRKDIYEMIKGCWRSCIEPGDGSGPPASDATIVNNDSMDTFAPLGDLSEKPFVADAIIANPPSFAHVHIAEKLGIPLHLMFTMPWSPTEAYPHPLANVLSSNTDQGVTNFMSYVLVDMLTWQGLGDVINRFREKVLRLEPISIIWAPGSLHRLRIPYTYAWSPALIPKPSDWPNFIDISGFFFLDLATSYTPPDDLATFLAAGKPPVYIGFGSIVVDDPNAMTKMIFEAVKLTGHRALVSKGWGGLSAGELGQPDDVFMLGNCPHDWLFQKVSAVVHHGGAGTTAAGVKAGRPTVIIPFFGDQPFWGNMVNRAGAGPKPIPYKELTAQKLADAILEALKPASVDKAADLSAKIQNENGPSNGADSFHKLLGVDKLRCSVAPGRAAVWRIKRTDIRLSALAATVLANSNLIDFSDLKLYRPREYEVDTGPPEPISGGAAAIIGSIGGVTASVADFPAEVLRGVKTTVGETKRKSRSTSTPSTPGSSVGHASSAQAPLASPSEHTITSSMSNFSGRSAEESTTASVVSDDESHTATPPSTIESVTDDRKSVLSADTDTTSTNRPGRAALGATLQNRPRRCSSQEARKITLGTAIVSAKAAGNIVAIGMKSPLDFTMSLAKGFHNLPRLYNDTTVRPAEKVTGFNSGLRAAGKTFAYGFMDGIGGLVTQPMQGYKEEGGSGLVKGLVKGSFGLVAKPSAAIWGLPAYTMQGIYAEISKNFGKSTTNYIIAARMTQGYEDFRESSEGERERIISAWQSPELADRYKRKRSARQGSEPPQSGNRIPATGTARLYDSNGQLLSGFFNTMHLTFDERKELARLKQEQQQQEPTQGDSQQSSTGSFATASDAEFRDAIREAVQRTSSNNTQQDQAIENAIWASVRELQRNRPESHSNTAAEAGSDEKHSDEEAYRRAVAASVAEYKRSQRSEPKTDENGQESGVLHSNDSNAEYDEDDQLTRAITASLEEYTRGMEIPDRRAENGPPLTSDDNDEEYKRALAESLKAQESNTSQSDTIKSPPSLPARGASSTGGSSQQNQSISHQHDEHDADLKEAIRLSEQEHAQRTSDLDRQRTEEDIVMEYVKKQSLAEEEYRKQRNG